MSHEITEWATDPNGDSWYDNNDKKEVRARVRHAV